MRILNNSDIIHRMKRVSKTIEDQELAEVLNINKSKIANWRRGTAIGVDLLFSFSQKYRTSIDWLVNGEEQAAQPTDLERLALTAFNALDDKAKIQMISLMNQGGQVNGITQYAGENEINKKIFD